MDSSPGITRDAFLLRVRQALGRASPLRETPTPPPVDDALVRLTDATEDLPALFAQRAAAVGTRVHRCNADELTGALLAVLDEHAVTSATVAESQLPDGPALVQAMRQHGIVPRPWAHDRTMAAHYDVDAGITGCTAALAETGTIIYNSGEGGGRGHMLVPPLHVVLIRHSDLLPDMLDAVAPHEGQPPAQLPASQSMITGPSKTADIEGVLITGVHGPGKVVAVLIEDLP